MEVFSYFLWNETNEYEYSSIGNAEFQGWLANKKTKYVSADTANAVANEHFSCNDFDDTSYSKDISYVDNNAYFDNDKDTLPPPSKFKRSRTSQRMRKRRKLKASKLEAKESNRLEQNINSK